MVDCQQKINREAFIVSRELLTVGEETGQDKTMLVNELIQGSPSYDLLKTFLTQNLKGLSIQWFNLTTTDIEIHEHAVDTLMIACKGQCQLTGDLETVLKEGDVVMIPKHFKHGLTPYKGETFWGFTLRFQ